MKIVDMSVYGGEFAWYRERNDEIVDAYKEGGMEMVVNKFHYSPGFIARILRKRGISVSNRELKLDGEK